MKLKIRYVPSIVHITVVALIIRIICTSWTGMTADECNATTIAVSGSLTEMLQHLRADGNAPIFYLLLREYTHLFGHHGFALRCFAVALATLAVPLTYLIFRQILAREFCLTLALLVALCPTEVCFGTMIRPYAIVGVLGLLSTMACVRTLSTGTNVWRVILYGVSTALLVCTHYWGALVPIGHVGLVATGLCLRWFGRREFLHWFAGAVLAFVLFLPAMVTAYEIGYGIGVGKSAFDCTSRALTLSSDFLPSLMLNPAYYSDLFMNLVYFICDFLVFLCFALPGAMMTNRADGGQSEQITYDGRMWKAATISGLVASFCVDFILPTMRYRYLLSFLPMVFVVYVTSINALFAKKSAMVRLVLPSLIWIALFIPFLTVLPSHPESTVELIVLKIAENCDRKKDTVLVSWELISPVVNFYLPAEIDSISYPHLDRAPFFRWTDIAPKLRDPDILPQLFGKLQTVLDRGGKIWLIDAAHRTLPLDYRNNSLALDCPFMDASVRRTDQIRSWLLTHSKQIGHTEMAPGRDFNIILTVFGPVGDDPAARAALPSPDSLWNSVDTDEHSSVRPGTGAK